MSSSPSKLADSIPLRLEEQGELSKTRAVNADAQRWCTLAIGSLVLAGLLSLAVVIGRLPFLTRLIDDPLFFKRCLVVHVDLSLSVWFYGFIASLLALRFRRDAGLAGKLAFGVSGIGVLAMIAGGLVRGAQPILSNYIPVIDHPLFLWGLALFFAGVLGFFILELSRTEGNSDGVLPVGPAIGLKASALMVALAAVTWVSAISGLPDGLDTTTFYEFSIWGAGHALQVANAAAMLAVWLWILEKATGSAVLSRRGALTLFGIMIAPHFILPALTFGGTMEATYHTGATLLMRWGIFPAMLFTLMMGIRHLRRHGGQEGDSLQRALLAGFWSSVSLTLLGVVLGFCIRGSNTLVPAHYHASLGGVTVAFMTAAYLVVHSAKGGDGLISRVWKSARKQLILFAVGQSVFALGFGLGGLYGAARKAYASEQHVRSMGEYIGLSTMGFGGIVAMVSGIWFLVIALREVASWWRSNGSQNGFETNKIS